MQVEYVKTSEIPTVESCCKFSEKNGYQPQVRYQAKRFETLTKTIGMS